MAGKTERLKAKASSVDEGNVDSKLRQDDLHNFDDAVKIILIIWITKLALETGTCGVFPFI